MKLDFYGIKIKPPTIYTTEAFGSKEEPVLLAGGQGTAYRSGNIVLKPSEGDDRANWMTNIFSNLVESGEVRFAKPIKSIHGNWIQDGYVAWTFLEGEHVKGQYDKKVKASQKFHNLLKDVPKPNFLNSPDSSWSAANEVVWQEQNISYDQEFMDLVNQIKPKLKPLDAKFQLTHGDLSGNFLIDPNLPLAVIDFSPVWAPNGFAEGVMLADAITWENAEPEDLEVFKEVLNIEQMAWRGILRRILEQAEHIKWFDKDRDQAVEEAREFQKAIDFLSNRLFK